MLVPEIMKCVHEFFPNYPDFDGIYELVVIFFFWRFYGRALSSLVVVTSRPNHFPTLELLSQVWCFIIHTVLLLVLAGNLLWLTSQFHVVYNFFMNVRAVQIIVSDAGVGSFRHQNPILFLFFLTRLYTFMMTLHLLLLPFTCFFGVIRYLVVLQRKSHKTLQIMDSDTGMERRMLEGNIMVIWIIEGVKNFVLQVGMGIFRWGGRVQVDWIVSLEELRWALMILPWIKNIFFHFYLYKYSHKNLLIFLIFSNKYSYHTLYLWSIIYYSIHAIFIFFLAYSTHFCRA